MQEIELLESIVIPDTWFISLVQVGVFQDREQMDGDFVELLNYLQVSTNLQADILSCDWTARGPVSSPLFSRRVVCE